MRIFDRSQLTGHKKWIRTAQALDVAPTLQTGSPTPSVTPSPTAGVDRRPRHSRVRRSPSLPPRRRAARRELLTRRDAPKAELAEQGAYCDLTDRQPFAGSGQVVRVPEGEVLVVDIDEAARILPDPAVEAVVLHVTVEGATFHNK